MSKNKQNDDTAGQNKRDNPEDLKNPLGSGEGDPSADGDAKAKADADAKKGAKAPKDSRRATWLGLGLLSIDDKRFKKGDVIAADKIGAEVFDELVEKGLLIE